jgi:hypothetical protein
MSLPLHIGHTSGDLRHRGQRPAVWWLRGLTGGSSRDFRSAPGSTVVLAWPHRAFIGASRHLARGALAHLLSRPLRHPRAGASRLFRLGGTTRLTRRLRVARSEDPEVGLVALAASMCAFSVPRPGVRRRGSGVDLLFVMRRPLSLMELGRLEDGVSSCRRGACRPGSRELPFGLLCATGLWARRCPCETSAAEAGASGGDCSLRGRGRLWIGRPVRPEDDRRDLHAPVGGYRGAVRLSAADREALFGDVWGQTWGCTTASPTDTSWSSRRMCAARSTATCR